MTVLFADLVGFTALSEDQDPEFVKRLIDRCFERLVSDITSFGGTVDKIIGDGIVALFGAPKAHEDDPERAVRAALRMQRSLADVVKDVELDVEMRVGINTGEVLVGAISAGGDYTAMGDTVNLASRLEGLAAPGEIYVGPSTYEATVSAIEYHERGSTPIRGRDDAIEVHVAVGELAPPGRQRRGFSAPMIGRNAEQLQLSTAIDTTILRNRAHLVLILGDGGMGKSRLAEEVASAAEVDHDALVLEGRVLPYGETNPYRPIAEALATAFEVQATDSDEAAGDKIRSSVARLLAVELDDETVHRITRVVLHIMGFDAGLGSLDATRRREEVQVGLRLLFDAAVKRRPIVLTLGDVNWADELLLSLIESLITALATQPFIVLATARWGVDEERWVVAPGRHNTTVLNLDALDRAASARLVRQLLGVDVSEQVTDALFTRSGGNPFFLEELTSMLRDAGAGAETRADLVGRLGELPDTLRGLVSARLDGLTKAERDMIDDAAVIGRGGPIYALLIMGEVSGDASPEQTFRQLVAKDLLSTETDHWTFRSDLVRDIAYNTQTKTDRAVTHLRIGEYLAARYDEDDRGVAPPGSIARHFAAVAEIQQQLGPVDGIPDDVVSRALRWLTEAGRIAEASSSHFVAAKFFAQALELIDGDDGRLVEIALGRARARLGLRELAGALEDADLARRVAFVRGDDAGLASALMMKGEVESTQGDRDEAQRHLSAALRRWRDLGDDAGTAEALRLRGMASLMAGDSAMAEADFDAALELFVTLDDSTGEAWCQQNLAWVAFEGGNTVVARERLDRAIEIFARNDDAGGLGWALGLAAFLHFHEGDSDEALAIAELVLEEAVRRGDRFGEPMMQLLLASISLWAGRCREAVDRAQGALRVFRDIESDFGVIQALGTLCRANAALGQFGESRAAVVEAAELAEIDSRNSVDFVRLVEAGQSVQVGDARRAVSLLEVVQSAPTDPRTLGTIDRTITHALAMLQLGDVESAREIASSAKDADVDGTYLASTMALIEVTRGDVPAARRLAAEVIASPKATYLDRRSALLAVALGHARDGDLDATVGAFAEAVKMIDETESRLSQAVVRLARSIAFRAVGHPEAARYEERVTRTLESLESDLAGWRVLFHAAVEPRSSVPAS